MRKRELNDKAIMKSGNRMVYQLNKVRFFLWYMGGLELYEPTDKQLNIWLHGQRN